MVYHLDHMESGVLWERSGLKTTPDSMSESLFATKIENAPPLLFLYFFSEPIRAVVTPSAR